MSDRQFESLSSDIEFWAILIMSAAVENKLCSLFLVLLAMMSRILYYARKSQLRARP